LKPRTAAGQISLCAQEADFFIEKSMTAVVLDGERKTSFKTYKPIRLFHLPEILF
jgi:hypothetical protein